MLIDLPSVREYSIADCQELFVSKVEDDCDDLDRYSSTNSKCDDRLRVPLGRGVRGHLSDAEPFTYTSSSESDADVCFSDIEEHRAVLPVQTSAPTKQKDLALHSPGQLLGTPRDPSRKYEYPFPAELRSGWDSGNDSSSSSSAATTPGLTPGEGYSLGLLALAAPIGGISILATGPPMYLNGTGLVPVPTPAPIPVATADISHSSNRRLSGTSLGPLSQVPAVPGPPSAPTLTTSSNMNSITNTSPNPNPSTSPSIAAHPKLSRFNPANTPVPPGLRGRTRTRTHKSASVSLVTNPSMHGHGAQSALPASRMPGSVSITVSAVVPNINIVAPSTGVENS